jgi:SAM-dependent methyltransferase
MAIEQRGAQQKSYPAEYYAAREGVMFRAEVKRLLAACALTPGARLLEVGCGGGGLLRSCVAPKRPVAAVGIDMNATAVSIARDRVEGAALALADAARLPFDDGSFDAVVAQHVIEHFERPDDVLREWRRVLVPQGIVAVATPNALYPDPVTFDDPTHYRIYSPASLRALFEEGGFCVEHCYSLMPFLGNRRLTWKLARLTLLPVPGIRHWPHFRTHGLTLVLSAKKPGDDDIDTEVE